MSLTVTIPFSRPENLGRLRAMLLRQRVRPDRVVVCENGRAIGACKAQGFTDAIVVTSEPHQATAKNEALAAVRRNGGRFVMIEDDDYYGPGYFEEIVANAGRADVTGKRHHWIRFRDGLYLFDRHGANRPSDWLHGPTLSGQVEDAAEFPRVKPDDDSQWCRAMRARGATFYAQSIGHYVYDRTRADHVWTAPDWLVRRARGRALRFAPGKRPDIAPPPDDAHVLSAMRELAFASAGA